MQLLQAADTVSIALIGNDGAETVLKSGLKLEAGEVMIISTRYHRHHLISSVNSIFGIT